MPDQPNLTDLFRSLDEGGDATKIDTKRVIARSRRRRLPAQVAVGGAFTVAAGALVVGVGAGLTSLGSASSDSASDSSADSAATAPTIQSAPEEAPGASADESGTGSAASGTSGIKRAPAEKINLCGGTLADVAPSATGLTLTPHFDNATAGATSVTGSVTLTNTGSETVTGTTAASPAITLSQDGVVLWHSNGPMIMMATEVNLAPGESMEYPATLVPVVCGVEDDSAEAFRDDLPAAPAGDYQVSAAIDLTGSDSADLVTGPTQTITLK